MIPKSKTFDIIICLVLLWVSYDPNPNKVLIGRIVEVNEAGEIVILENKNIHKYLLYGLNYESADIETYKIYLKGMVIGSNVRVVEIDEGRAIIFWYKNNLNLLMIQSGIFNVEGCDLSICDEWEMEQEKYQLERKAIEEQYGPF